METAPQVDVVLDETANVLTDADWEHWLSRGSI